MLNGAQGIIDLEHVLTLVTTMKNKIDEYEQRANYYNDICESNIFGKDTNLKDRFSELIELLSLMDEKVPDVQWRSMRKKSHI